MSIFVDENTRVIVQGLTGSQGRFHGLRNRDYGTMVVGGVTPGKGGTDVDGVPVYDSVREAVEATGATASFVAVPPRFASAAIIEAAQGGIPSVMHTTKLMPPWAASMMAAEAKRGGTATNEAVAPVASTASRTESKTGTPSTSVPPLPGVTPPTTWVP